MGLLLAALIAVVAAAGTPKCGPIGLVIDAEGRARVDLKSGTVVASCPVAATVSLAYALRTSLSHIAETNPDHPTLPLVLLLIDEPEKRHPALAAANDTIEHMPDEVILQAKDHTDLGFLPRASTEQLVRIHDYVTKWAVPYNKEGALVLFPFGRFDTSTETRLVGQEFEVRLRQDVSAGQSVVHLVKQ